MISQLREGLNSIVFWLHNQQKKYPHITQNWWLRYPTEKYPTPYCKRRLSEETIKALVSKLNLQITSELYDLYQWFDGTKFGDSIWDSDWLFDVNLTSQEIKGVGLLSLESLVKEYLEKQSFYQEENYQQLAVIPDPLSHLSGLDAFVGQNYLEGCFIVDRKNVLSTIRIREYQKGNNSTLVMYSSLTNMVQTFAESYQQAYDFDEQGNLHKDLAKIRVIWSKYNSSYFVIRTLERFNSIKDKIIELEQNISVAWLQEIGDILQLTQNEKLLKPLIAILAQPPTNNIWNTNLDYLRSQSSNIIAKFGNKMAIPDLIKQLNSEYWITRYWAVQTLGKIPQISIIEPLKKLLQDEQPSVRFATQRALKNLQQIENNNQLIMNNHPKLPLNRDLTIEETNQLMKNLNFTVTEGREYLLKHYGKRSRLQLTNQELLAFRDYLKEKVNNPEQNKTPQPTTETSQSNTNDIEVIEIEFNDLLKQIDRLMKQLNWTKEDGEGYLLAQYRKRSRFFLTDEEILEFRDMLQQEVSKIQKCIS